MGNILYKYEGAVKDRTKILSEKWSGYTMAPSERKARSNLAFRFNLENGYGPHRRVYLVGAVKKVIDTKIDDGEQLSFF